MLSKIIAFLFVAFIPQGLANPDIAPFEHPLKSKRPALTVSTVSPRLQNLTQTITATGDIVAKEVAVVASQVSGLSLKEILVDVGDIVTQGQVLAKYDGLSVANDIAQATAVLQQATVAEKQARSNAKRAKRLDKNHAMSQIERDNFYFQAQQAQANLAAAQATLDNQKLRASYTQVKAPAAGLIIEKQAILGSIGHSGNPLFTLVVNNELEWLAQVPVTLLPHLRPAMPVHLRLPALTSNSHQSPLSGKIRRIEPIINQQTRQATVRVALDKHPMLRQGLFVSGLFILGEKKQLTIPVTCLKQQDGHHYIFILAKDNKIRKQKVTVEQLSDNRAGISSGLSITDQVISTGVGFLNHGDLVQVIN